MKQLLMKKGLLVIMTLTFSVMLNWCDLTLDFLGHFEGIFAEDKEEEVIEPLPEPDPEPELADNVDLGGLTEKEFIAQMFNEMIAAEKFQIIQTEDVRLEEEPTFYYFDTRRNIYAIESNGITEEYMYGTDTERVLLRNPMTRHFNELAEKSVEDPTYEDRLMAANEEMDKRFLEIRWDQNYSVDTPSFLFPVPEAAQIENAEIYGDVVRGDLTQAYLQESHHFSIGLGNLDPDDELFVEVEVNPHANTITFSERYDIKNPETSETWRLARLGLQNRTYEISETDKELPELEAIGVLHENEAHSILQKHDLREFYEKF